MVGGQLTTSWLLDAYQHGVFPWPIVEGSLEILAWFAPDPRAVFELDQFHVSRRLARRMRAGPFTITGDHDFRGVMLGCSEQRRGQSGTWITPAMVSAYCELHRLGHAHSVEVWQDKKLVGGVYGVAIGGMFAGESAFHRVTDASKIAIFQLVSHLRKRGFALFDIQQATPHSLSLGATTVPRNEFVRRLRHAIRLNVTFGQLPTAGYTP